MDSTLCSGTGFLEPTGKFCITHSDMRQTGTSNSFTGLFGRSYDPKDRVNPRSQIDPKTGKSYEYAEEKSR